MLPTSDIEDEDQTVTMHTSEIGTTATDKPDGDKTVIADAESTVTDKVEYDHVLTGKAYTMAGILMDENRPSRTDRRRREEVYRG